MPDLGERIKGLSLELTKIASVVGTQGEVDAALYIYDHFKKLDYFVQNPGNLRIKDVKQDPLNRKYVMAFMEGNMASSGTVLILGHIDTVGIEDYGDLKEYAAQPEKLKQQLSEKSFDEDISEDLKSDNWIFGRGVFDMKTGVASLMVMVEEFSKRLEKLHGNLVFIAVPDEEGNSAGMLSAVQDLAELSKARGWEFIAAIDTDYMTGQYAGDENRYVYVGTVGKLLPCFYV